MSSTYGGPYAAENDVIDEALRNGTINKLSTKGFSDGAKALIASYKDKTAFESPVGEFVINSHPSEEVAEEDAEFPADKPLPGLEDL